MGSLTLGSLTFGSPARRRATASATSLAAAAGAEPRSVPARAHWGNDRPRRWEGPRVSHILLIEDDPRIRVIVERGLGARGFIVTSSHDGPAGLEIVHKLEVDLVILDLILPGAHGLRVLEELRTVRPRLPVIVLTAI